MVGGCCLGSLFCIIYKPFSVFYPLYLLWMVFYVGSCLDFFFFFVLLLDNLVGTLLPRTSTVMCMPVILYGCMGGYVMSGRRIERE